MSIQEYINNIDLKSSQSNQVWKEIHQITWGEDRIYIISELYQNGIIIEDFADIKHLPQYVLNHQYYISILKETNEPLSIPDGIPVVITYFFDNAEFDYSLLSQENVYFDCASSYWYLPIIDEVIRAGRLFVENNFSLLIIIKNIDEKTPSVLKRAISYLSQFNSKARIRIEIKTLEDFANLPKILADVPDETVVNIPPDFFMDNPVAYDIVNNNAAIFNNSPKKITYHYKELFDYQNISSIIAFEKTFSILKSRIPADALPIDIITFLTEFMISYFSLDFEDQYKLRTLGDFVIDKKGVCRDYAGFADAIFKRLNIDCKLISAASKNGEEGHSWNLINIDGKSCYLDITWLVGEFLDGSINSTDKSPNFLASTDTFNTTHADYMSKLHDNCEDYPRDEIKKSIRRVRLWKYNYYIHKDALLALIKNHKTKQEKEIEQAMPGVLPQGGQR